MAATFQCFNCPRVLFKCGGDCAIGCSGLLSLLCRSAGRVLWMDSVAFGWGCLVAGYTERMIP